MANHGMGRLVLVAPPAFDPDVARWMATRGRHRIDSALIVGSVADAIDALDVARVIGTTARPRRLETPVWGPERLCEVMVGQPAPTAIVFGPEDFGLDNASVARCDAVLRIPTAEHSSLNLSQAVQVTASSLAIAARSAPAAPPQTLASAKLRRLMTDDLLEVLSATAYFSGRTLTPTRARVTAAVARLSLDHDTVANARGMLKSVLHRLRRPAK